MNGTTTITRSSTYIIIENAHSKYLISIEPKGMYLYLCLPDKSQHFLKSYSGHKPQNIATAINYILKEQCFFI